MCDVLIPALIGVAALGLLGGGVGIGGDNCNPCAAGGSGYSITIPQEVGDVTNGYAVPVAQQGYAPQYAQAPAPAYGYAPMAGPGYAATAPAYGPGVGASVDVNGQSALGAGGYMNPEGAGVGANVGGFGASVGVDGPRAY